MHPFPKFFFFSKSSKKLNHLFLKGNRDSLPQEIEVQQESQNKGKRHLDTILTAQEQHTKMVFPKPKKIYPIHTSELRKLMYYPIELPFQVRKTTRAETAQGSHEHKLSQAHHFSWQHCPAIAISKVESAKPEWTISQKRF